MLSDRDLAVMDVSRLLSAEGAEGLRRRWSQPVIHVMSSDVVAVEPETDLGELLDVFIEEKIGALPVVTHDTRQLVGIVSYMDVLGAVRDLLDEIE